MPDADRVLFLSPQPFFEWRGSPIRVGFDVQALAELGFEVDLLTMPVGRNREIPGVRVLRVPNLLGVRALPIGPSPAKAVLDLAMLVRALRLARRRRYAVVHGVEEAGAIAVGVARRYGARVVFEKHSDPGSHRKGAIRNAVLAAYGCVERLSIRRADAVICTGEGLARQARATGTHAAVHCIPDIPSSLVCADPAQVQAMRARFCSAPDEVLALYVGSFAVYQGIDLLFDAIARVASARKGVRFVIYGGSADEVENRRRRLAEQGCDGAVTFAGFIAPDELPHALAAADILLSPRLSGVNTPLKLLDYLKAGAAIAAVDSPANRLILDERTAVLTAAEAAAFAAGIVRLAGDAALRRTLGEQGRRLQETVYSYAVFKRGLAACYAGLGRAGANPIEPQIDE